MNTLYQEKIMDHYRNPRNYGTLHNPDFSSGLMNPSCGDSIEIQGTLQNGAIVTLAFTGKGCVLSQASASLLTQFCQGKTIEDIKTLSLACVTELLGIEIGPVRSKCATLPLMALQKGINTVSIASSC